MISLKKYIAAFFVSLAVAIAAGLTGCGGGGDETENASPLSKSQFTKQANAVCQEGLEKKELKLQQAIASRPANLRATPRVLELVAVSAIFPIYGETISKLGELQPPVDDEEEVGKVVDQYETALKSSKANPSLVLKGNPFRKGDEAAEKYGLEGCTL